MLDLINTLYTALSRLSPSRIRLSRTRVVECNCVDSVVADYHVCELYDMTVGLSTLEHYVKDGSSERASTFVSKIDEEAECSVSDEGGNQGEATFSDDDMDLTPRTRRDVDETLERQDKTARGEEAREKECNTLPYPRAARRARVPVTSTPPASHIMPNEPTPIAPPLNLNDHTRAFYQPITLSSPHNHPYQQPILGFNNALVLNPLNYGMSLNLHLGNAMPPPNPVGTWGNASGLGQ